MKAQEWIEQAIEFERKAQEAFENGDEIEAERCTVKAQSCRYNATLGTVEND